MNIVIYSRSACPNCTTAKRLLDSKGIGFEEIVATEDVINYLAAQYPEARQMPQIFINGQRVGGLAGLQAALNWPEAALKELGL